MRTQLTPYLFALCLSTPAFAGPASGGSSTTTVTAADELEPLARAIEANPDEAKSYDDYATAAMKKGRFDDAITKLKVGVARLPDFPRGYLLLGIANRSKKAWADAAIFYRCYHVQRPAEIDALFGLAKSLEGLGDKKGAAATYKKYLAAEKRPTMQKYIDDAKAALAILEAPPGPNVSSPEAIALKAEADKLKGEKKFEEAALAYRKAIEIDRGNLELYNELGNAYFALKRYSDAAQAFKDAVSRDEGYALGWYNLAHAMRKADRKAEAVEAYKRYIKLKPEDPDPYYGLGQTLKQLGDNAGAASYFKKYVVMEKRPDQQKWVDKARQEIAAIEGGPGGGKVTDEK